MENDGLRRENLSFRRNCRKVNARWRMPHAAGTIPSMPRVNPTKTRSLTKYHEKRNFTASPEPKGDVRTDAKKRAKAKALFFCVQKHLASHLHYDFRLEHRGVRHAPARVHLAAIPSER